MEHGAFSCFLELLPNGPMTVHEWCRLSLSSMVADCQHTPGPSGHSSRLLVYHWHMAQDQLQSNGDKCCMTMPQHWWSAKHGGSLIPGVHLQGDQSMPCSRPVQRPSYGTFPGLHHTRCHSETILVISRLALNCPWSVLDQLMKTVPAAHFPLPSDFA